jgi:hypothetical protein
VHAYSSYKLVFSHSVFSATLLLFITALFREPKARDNLQLESCVQKSGPLISIVWMVGRYDLCMLFLQAIQNGFE